MLGCCTYGARSELGNIPLNSYAAGMRVILIRYYQTQSNAEGRSGNPRFDN